MVERSGPKNRKRVLQESFIIKAYGITGSKYGLTNGIKYGTRDDALRDAAIIHSKMRVFTHN